MGTEIIFVKEKMKCYDNICNYMELQILTDSSQHKRRSEQHPLSRTVG